MNFHPFVKNQVTEISVRRGDDILTISHEYDVEDFETIIKDFQCVLKFLSYAEDDLKEYFKEEIIDEYEEELKESNND